MLQKQEWKKLEAIEHLPRHFLKINRRRVLKIGPLVKLILPKTKSKLIINNNYEFYGWIYFGLEGLFRKDDKITHDYGGWLCNLVKTNFHCGGFFTSDELPKYGISRKETRSIFGQMKKKAGDGNLITFCVYDKELTKKIQTYLTKLIRREL